MKAFHKEIVLACFLCALLSLSAFSRPSDSAVADMSKNVAAVQSFIQQKADVNAPQPDGSTALQWAARWDDMQLAAALIKAGADPRNANRVGASPMFLAAQNGSAMMIELLLRSGVDPNAP